VDSTPSHGAEPRIAAARGEALPVDPHFPPAERVPQRRQVSPQGGAARRRARPRLLWGRLARVVVRRRDVLAVIAVGGALGSLGRWGVAEALPHRPGAFAWSTFVVNVSGCFLIGLLMVFVVEVWPPSRYLRAFVGVGVLGGYTTFSTYMLDTRSMLVSGATGAAGAYVLGSIGAGFAAVWVAILVGRSIVTISRRRRGRRRERIREASSASLDRPARARGAGQLTAAETGGRTRPGRLRRSDRAPRRMP